MSVDWNETLHPRHPAGSESGGEFSSKVDAETYAYARRRIAGFRELMEPHLTDAEIDRITEQDFADFAETGKLVSFLEDRIGPDLGMGDSDTVGGVVLHQFDTGDGIVKMSVGVQTEWRQPKTYVVLSDISTSPRGKGLGTDAMLALKEYADERGFGITVHRADVEWYDRFPWLTKLGGPHASIWTYQYEPSALTAAAWDPAKHPRHPAGSESGGEFAPKLFTYGDTRARDAIDAWVAGLDMGDADTLDSVEFLRQRLDGAMQTALPALQDRLDDALVPAWVSPLLSDDQIDLLANPEVDFSPDFDVALGPEPFAPSFTVFTFDDGRYEVEDVLDLGDTDFFPGGAESPLAQNYAKLVDAAGRTPGSPDTVTLFRGMSPEELLAWKAGEPIPPGKFFTDQPTVNYAQDQAGVFPELQEFTVPRSAVMRTGPNEFQLSRPATYKDGKLVSTRIEAPDPGRYPASEGGHRRGWGLGPDYRIAEDRMPGAARKLRVRDRVRDRLEARRQRGVTAAVAFDEMEHPRHPAGSPQGGRWRSATNPDAVGSERDEAWTGPPIVPGELNRKDLGGGSGVSALGRSEQYWRQHGYDVSELADEYGVTVDGYRDMVAHVLQDEAKGDIVIRTPMHGYKGVDPALEIIDTGRFKSQHETGVSMGALATDVRVLQEKLFFGYPQNLPERLRPIYGLVDSTGGHAAAQNYGEVLWVLKDDVRTRTTVSGVDSLSRPVVPGPINNPGWRATVPPGYAANVHAPVEDPVAMGFALNPEYVEAQIHGGVSLTDVDHVDVVDRRPNAASHKADVDRLSALLAPHGITVTAYEDAFKRHRGEAIVWTQSVIDETSPG